MKYVYLFLSICIAVIGSITDLNSGRVRNKHLLAALGIWVALLAIELIAYGNSSYDVLAVSINVALALVSTIILYLNDIWAPGDGKLFLILALIYPISLSPCNPGNIFPILDVIVFSFAAGYIGLLVSSLKRSEKNPSISTSDLAKFFSVQRTLSMISNIGIASMCNWLLDKFAGNFLATNQALCTLLIVILIYLLQQKVSILRKIVGLCGLIFYSISAFQQANWLSIISTLTQSILIAVAIEVLNQRIRKHSYREITAEEVKPGIILSYSSVWNMQNCIDPDIPKATTESRRSRLNVKQAEAVKLWCKNTHLPVSIVEMVPFAPCIAIAVIIHIVRFLIFY